MSTVWLLDVDGVINANRPGWGGAPWNGTAYADGYPYRIRWAPALIDRIRAIDSGTDARIYWCTTWCHEIRQIERILRLDGFDLAWSHRIDPKDVSAAKLAAASDVVSSGHRLVWTDDEAIPEDGPERDALTGEGNALLITPRAVNGLQPGHMDAIGVFCAGQQHPTPSQW